MLLQVLMDAEVLALAVMTDLLSGEQRRRYTDMIDSPYMPALRAPVLDQSSAERMSTFCCIMPRQKVDQPCAQQTVQKVVVHCDA